MNIIQKVSIAAGLAVALTASASAFPFLVSARNTALVPPANNSPTIAVYTHGQGVGKATSSKEVAPPVATQPTAPRYSSHRWR